MYYLYLIVNLICLWFNLALLWQVDYKDWLVAQIGLPPLEDWMEQMLRECFKNVAEMKENYRDEWDDNQWDAVIQTESASLKQMHCMSPANC